jgi:ATP-dependent Clp protease ATP-binding subunit ClpA
LWRSERFSDNYGSELSFGPNTIATITDRCTSQSLGARWAEQIITERVVSPLAGQLLDRLAQGLSISDVTMELSPVGLSLCWNDAGAKDAA